MTTLTQFADEHGTIDEINRDTPDTTDTNDQVTNTDPGFEDTDEDEKPWKTDEFGNPTDRNYHYRIPLADDAAATLAFAALDGTAYPHRRVQAWNGFTGATTDYIGLQTTDNKGTLEALGEYTHSPEWHSLGPFTDIDEYRQNPARGGGTKIKGSFNVDPKVFAGLQTLTFKTTIPLTPTELEAANEHRGDDWRTVKREIRQAKQESIENARETIANEQRNCDHEHAVMDGGTLEHAAADGYCEDCGAELTSSKKLAYNA